jgi:hypothetical protein
MDPTAAGSSRSRRLWRIQPANLDVVVRRRNLKTDAQLGPVPRTSGPAGPAGTPATARQPGGARARRRPGRYSTLKNPGANGFWGDSLSIS